jgi:hypothetical protein
MHPVESLVDLLLFLAGCVLRVEVFPALSYLCTFLIYLRVPFFILLVLYQGLFEFLLLLLLFIFLVSRLVFEELVEPTGLFFAVGLGFESAFLHFC